MITKPLHQRLTPYYFLAPALAVLTVVILFPIISNVTMSLHKVQLLKGGEDQFVGFDNYARLLGSSTFRGSVSASLRFTFLSLPLALILCRSRRGKLRTGNSLPKFFREPLRVPASKTPFL